MTEKRAQDALRNLDSIVSKVSLTRVEHAQLVSDLDVVSNVCQEHFKPKEEKPEEEEKKEPEGD